MIGPATGWIKIVQYNDKQSDTISNLVEQAWLCKYPMNKIITYNRGNELLILAFKNDLIKKGNMIKANFSTAKHPRLNPILEQIRQVIVNLVRTFDL